jgi:glucose/arabinose dehydrogenase
MHARQLALAVLTALATGMPACGAEPDTGDAPARHGGQHDFRLETVAEGLVHPWSLAFLPDGDFLVTERPGRLLRIDPQNGVGRAIGGLPVVAAVGQGGLLDVTLHPDFADNRWVYLSYAAAGEGGHATRVGRGRLRGDKLADFQVLFTAEPFVSGGRHFGSRLLFDDDGALFVTAGERGRKEHAQDLGKLHGKLIRLHDDGSIPRDNPFVGEPGVREEIYSYGHRNPQGIALHPETRRVWLHEHGPRGGDEINIPEPGANYGWPETTHGRAYSGIRFAPEPPVAGYVSPIHHWTPSIAPSGMAFYTGDIFPEWRGDLFVGALVLSHLARLELDGETVVAEEKLLDEDGWRIRDVRTGPDGYLYLLVDADDAPLLRLMPAD